MKVLIYTKEPHTAAGFARTVEVDAVDTITVETAVRQCIEDGTLMLINGELVVVVSLESGTPHPVVWVFKSRANVATLLSESNF